MFVKKSFADEIASSMQDHLVNSAETAALIEKQTKEQALIVQAADHLNAAAEIYDANGMMAEAELITGILEVLAAKKAKKKDKNRAKDKKSKKPAKKPVKKKAPSSEKMVQNLKEKGWMFDENGAKDGQVDHSCVDDNCAACGDMSYADDPNEEELYSMLEDFKSRSADADFEDEEDDFDVEVYDPYL